MIIIYAKMHIIQFHHHNIAILYESKTENRTEKVTKKKERKKTKHINEKKMHGLCKQRIENNINNQNKSCTMNEN